MEILDIESWEIPYCSPLDDQEIQRYARMDSWSLREAVMLSLGYLPARRGDRQSETVAKDVGLKVRDRWDLVNRAMLSGKVKYTTRPYRLGSDTPEYCFEPAVFLAWLESAGFEFHTGIAEAVKIFRQGESRESTKIAAVVNKSAGNQITKPQELKDSYFRDLGAKKGEAIREVIQRAKEFLVDDYQNGCNCSPPDAAKRLKKLRLEDGTYRFKDPRKRSNEVAFIEDLRSAAIEARRLCSLPVKGDPGYKKPVCKKHRTPETSFAVK